MRIDGFTPHVARAYGIQPSQPTAAVGSVRPIAPVAQAPGADRADQVPQGLRDLIAGRAPGAIDFDQSSPIHRTSNAVLQLYTRAADKIEAATGIQLGRSLDVEA